MPQRGPGKSERSGEADSHKPLVDTIATPRAVAVIKSEATITGATRRTHRRDDHG